MRSVILRAGARLLVALLLIFSVFMLLRGHNVPGGGFIGGLIGAVGFVVYAISCGTAEARDALRLPPERIAMIGLGISLFSGFMALVAARAPFTGQWLFIGATDTDKGLPLSSVLVFDIGVYLVVMGAILALVFALEEEV